MQNKISDSSPEGQKDSVIKREIPTLKSNSIQEQIQKDYKSNLLKRRMAEDEVRHKKNQSFTQTKPVDSKEDYSIKDGVHLSQDISFDDLLGILREAEEETDEEDIEDRIARYRIIEKRIQTFQAQSQNNMQYNNVDSRNKFAREFVANARKEGYEVKLDDNFKVKSVKKIHIDPYKEALFMDENN